MRRYYTGLLLHSYENLQQPLRGRGWSISIEKKLNDDLRRSSACNLNEIVIHAKTEERAQATLTLILDSWTVLTGIPPAADDLEVIPADYEERKKWELGGSFKSQQIWSTSGLSLGCLIALRASMKRKLTYAIGLCRQSIALHANDPVELHPSEFPYRHRSLSPRDHVRFAYAIVTAYAVFEQLGLSLHDKCFHNGNWIKEKRNDLEHRLTLAGINLNDTVYWMLRGGKTKLEEKRPPTIVRKCAWARGQIRDCEVDFVDAIADLRWFRSRVAAHDVASLASVLSVHDVSNAQKLARRAVLESMGFDKAKISELYQTIKRESEQE